MLRLRTYISLLLLWFILFFNIERLAEIINIASFVYVYFPVLAGIVIFWPKAMHGSGRRIFIPVSLVIYAILKSLLGYPLLGPALPLTVTEIVAALVTIALADRISAYVNKFEETVANLTFQQIGLPPRLYDSTDTEDLYREVKRCRRFQHPLSLLIVRPEFDPSDHRPGKLLMEMQNVFANRYVQARLAKLFSDGLRDTDLVVIQNNELIALLPETKEKDARMLIEKLTDLADRELGVGVNVGLSNFPTNSVTLNGLLDFAQGDLEQKLKRHE